MKSYISNLQQFLKTYHYSHRSKFKTLLFLLLNNPSNSWLTVHTWWPNTFANIGALSYNKANVFFNLASPRSIIIYFKKFTFTFWLFLSLPTLLSRSRSESRIIQCTQCKVCNRFHSFFIIDIDVVPFHLFQMRLVLDRPHFTILFYILSFLEMNLLFGAI